MKKIFLLIASIFIVIMSFAQFDTMFNDTLRPFGDGAYTLKSICKDDSFKYILGGVNNYQPKWNLMILKQNKNGDIINKKKFYDSLLYYSAAPYNSILVKNNRILFCTTIRDSSNIVNGMIICLNKHSLDTIWTRIYPHPDTANILSLADKFSILTSIKSTPDNNYILTGNYMRAGSERSYLMKIDSLGNVIWTRAYDNVKNIYNLDVTPNENYAFVSKFGGTYFTITNSIGEILWHKKANSYIGSATLGDLKYTGNNCFVISTAYMYNNDMNNPLMGVNVYKINTINRDILWDKTFQLYSSLECITLHQAMGVETLANGNIIVTGTLTKHGGDRLGFILKLNSGGDSLWTRTYSYGTAYDDSQLNDILLCDDGGFMGVGFFSSEWASVNDAAWMFKTDANGVIGWETPKPNADIEKIKVWPNPASEFVNIKFNESLQQNAEIIIYNSLGKEVKRERILKNKISLKLEIDNLENGVYFYEVVGEKGIIGKGKFVKE